MAPGAVAAGSRRDDTEEHNGKVKVALGPETQVLQPPRGKDIDQRMIVDLRRMLTAGGIRTRRLSIALA